MKKEKLVRDKIPAILKRENTPCTVRILRTQKERLKSSIRKVREESGEFLEKKTPEELADLLESIYTCMKFPKYRNVEAIRLEKRRRLGGFGKFNAVRFNNLKKLKKDLKKKKGKKP